MGIQLKVIACSTKASFLTSSSEPLRQVNTPCRVVHTVHKNIEYSKSCLNKEILSIIGVIKYNSYCNFRATSVVIKIS